MMQLSNCDLKSIVSIDNLVIGSIGTALTLAVTVTVAGADFAVGDGVLVTPRAALTNGIALYGIVTGATTLQFCFVNASAAPIDPADTFDFDAYVFAKSGNMVTGV